LQADVLTETALQQGEQVLDNGVHADGAGLGELLAGEAEQLAHEVRRAHARLHNPLQVLLGGVVFREASLRQLRETQDSREQVVEVVRDAPRELPDALQLLGLEQASLQRLALRDVDISADEARLPRVLNGEQGRQDDTTLAVGSSDFPLLQWGGLPRCAHLL
jgi:hypothetical protein